MIEKKEKVKKKRKRSRLFDDDDEEAVASKRIDAISIYSSPVKSSDRSTEKSGMSSYVVFHWVYIFFLDINYCVFC